VQQAKPAANGSVKIGYNRCSLQEPVPPAREQTRRKASGNGLIAELF
jgi:hypothetical protein